MNRIEQYLESVQQNRTIRLDSLKKEDKKAYIQVVEKSRILGFRSVAEYLDTLGMVCAEEVVNEDMQVLANQVKELFTNDVINAKEIYESRMYYKLHKGCRQNSISIKEFLEQLGYCYEKASNKVSKFDYESIRKIHKEYIPNQSIIAELFGTTRQVVNNIINNKVKDAASGDKWAVAELEDEEEDLILNMLLEKEYHRTEEDLSAYIICDGKGKLMLLFREADYVKVMFDEDIPIDLHELLDEAEMTTLFEDEREFIQNCTFVHVLNKRCIQKNEKINRIKWESFRKNYYSRRGWEEKNDCKEVNIYGFVTPNSCSYENIVEILSEAADENNIIATTNPLVAKISRHYNHYKHEKADELFDYSEFESFGEFLAFHDFYLIGHHAHPEEVRQQRKNVTDAKYRALLKEYIVVPGTNLVSFTSYDSIYRGLYNSYRNRNMANISEYVMYLGYEYVEHTEEKLEKIKL